VCASTELEVHGVELNLVADKASVDGVGGEVCASTELEVHAVELKLVADKAYVDGVAGVKCPPLQN